MNIPDQEPNPIFFTLRHRNLISFHFFSPLFPLWGRAYVKHGCIWRTQRGKKIPHSQRRDGISKVKLKVLVTQLYLTFFNSINCSLPGYSIHGILQARILEWVAISFSRGSSQPRDWPWVFCIAEFAIEPPGKPRMSKFIKILLEVQKNKAKSHQLSSPGLFHYMMLKMNNMLTN